ncbi:putative Cytochrome b2, mitochondrial (putative) [Rhodotorula toruloides]|nr:putative Cytochrome b2, mitochondrial (putative) [Rhodotorula toruloides]
MLTGADVAKHNSSESLWMIINGKAYDLTEFQTNHPGGQKILLKFAGRDATEEYEPIHPPGTIEEALPADKHLGEVDMSTLLPEQKIIEQAVPKPTTAGDAPMTLGACLNLDDIEKAAERLLKPKAWAYYRSAADDERTHNWNRESFYSVRLRPRVLRDVTTVDLSASILGHTSSLPIYISPAAMGRLAHPDGEKCLARVAAAHQIPYMVSANASVGFEELASQAKEGQILFYQAICVTVDAPVAGKRERDERAKLDDEAASDPNMQKAVKSTGPDAPDAPQDEPSQGIAQALGSDSLTHLLSTNCPSSAPPTDSGSISAAMFSYVDPTLAWHDLEWVRKASGGLPIIVKGIQCAEDAALAAKNGAQAIILSNHGGRQLEGAPSSLETLLEIRKFEPWVLKKLEVWCDGGFRRGTDVLKAIALGARCVGIGRPFMYSLVFGDEGVNKVATVLREELAQNARLMGATSMTEVVPSMVNARELEQNVYNGPYESPVRALAKL